MDSLLAMGFDLDFTLWDQGRFALSFFQAVAGEAGRKLGLPAPALEAAFQGAWRHLGPGHPRLFDEALRGLDRTDPALVADLVARWRAHRPPLRPYPEALPVLGALRRRGLRLFLVTDGNGSAQRYKVEALGLAGAFEARVFTGDRPGLLRKPGPFPFVAACHALGVPAPRCAFVGDNPATDFLGPRCLGMLAVGVATGPFAARPSDGGPGPHLRIRDLRDLEGLL